MKTECIIGCANARLTGTLRQFSKQEVNKRSRSFIVCAGIADWLESVLHSDCVRQTSTSDIRLQIII